jgi:hypothetical protein
MKKLLVSTMITLLLVIVLTSTTFAAPTAAERELLFKGSLQAVETNQLNFPILSVDAAGSGKATQLGRFTIHYQVEVNVLTLWGSGPTTLIAADGSRLFAEVSGQATQTGTPNVVTILATGTITGGTGRFAGASGSFTVERVLDQTTGVTSGTISGTIVLP